MCVVCIPSCSWSGPKQLYAVAMETSISSYHFIDSGVSSASDSKQGGTDEPENEHEP